MSCTDTPSVFEYPALRFLYREAHVIDGLFYYFHTKGISYYGVDTTDRLFLRFKRKIEAWRELLEYFMFSRWRLAVNRLQAGFDAYGCLRWPPRNYTMFSGNFWWATSHYLRGLPLITEESISQNRFYAEVWLWEKTPRVFSPFDSIADPYFVYFPPSLYKQGEHNVWQQLCFVWTYNWRKFCKKVLRYNYKKHCQRRFQKLG